MNLVAEFTRQFQGTKDDPTLIFERLYSTTPSDLWDAMTTPERLARWFGTFTGTETYKPLIGAHEETAHKIWRELIG
ncbi:hypothetical protein HGQ17_00265 [Nesterenkonia sp. MY13]|uniref:SRPBCC domain-containing protein n=1 Tax=Nesterenkonia sedimenti TaxID=1463632 RepID=A0A7X8TH51_9MICC|nr:hypothetical protein [Nesterenkonia sedimenti]NLS08464.1 hypothetical protein [Nesterenkonia sedimenti]